MASEPTRELRNINSTLYVMYSTPVSGPSPALSRNSHQLSDKSTLKLGESEREIWHEQLGRAISLSNPLTQREFGRGEREREREGRRRKRRRRPATRWTRSPRGRCSSWRALHWFHARLRYDYTSVCVLCNAVLSALADRRSNQLAQLVLLGRIRSPRASRHTSTPPQDNEDSIL